MTEMYAHKEQDGTFTLRQKRYSVQLAQGKEHPHDVCAVARSVEELKSMCAKHWPTADFSEVEDKTADY